MTAASAYSPHPSNQATPEPRSQEPSMEDILASIRRIIADDQNHGSKSGNGNGARRAPPAEAERNGARLRTAYDDVLDLARLTPGPPPSMASDHPVSAEAAAPVAAPPLHHGVEASIGDTAEEEWQAEAHRPEEPAVGAGLRAPEPMPYATDDVDATALVRYEADDGDPLISEPLGASVMSAFETLAATVVLQNTPMLEGVMRDLLRPMLKTWLDDNLPALVERLVRTEIERVARGGRG